MTSNGDMQCGQSLSREAIALQQRLMARFPATFSESPHLVVVPCADGREPAFNLDRCLGPRLLSQMSKRGLLLTMQTFQRHGAAHSTDLLQRQQEAMREALADGCLFLPAFGRKREADAETCGEDFHGVRLAQRGVFGGHRRQGVPVPSPGS